jgi:hypothetical protein
VKKVKKSKGSGAMRKLKMHYLLDLFDPFDLFNIFYLFDPFNIFDPFDTSTFPLKGES